MTKNAKLTILDVGHGNSAVLETTSGVVVIDAGRRNSLLEYLCEQGIGKLDLILVSHADEDHLGGLLAILSSGIFELGRIRLNTDSLKGTAIWDDLLYELNHLQQLGRVDFEPVLTENQVPIFEHGHIRMDVLAPSRYLAAKGPGSTDSRGRRISTNSISAVIRITSGTSPVAIFPGDLDEIGLEHLLESGRDLAAAVLVFPHHGGRSRGRDASAFASQLCDVVRPKQVVFSIGRTKFSNPLPEVVAGVRQSNRDIWISCTQLSKRCASDLPDVHPTHLTDVYADGKQARHCCVGTLVISLEMSEVSVLPLYGAHQDFISGYAPTAICRLPGSTLGR